MFLKLPKGVIDTSKDELAAANTVADSMGLGSVKLTEDDTSMDNSSSYREETVDASKLKRVDSGVDVEEI